MPEQLDPIYLSHQRTPRRPRRERGRPDRGSCIKDQTTLRRLYCEKWHSFCTGAYIQLQRRKAPRLIFPRHSPCHSRTILIRLLNVRSMLIQLWTHLNLLHQCVRPVHRPCLKNHPFSDRLRTLNCWWSLMWPRGRDRRPNVCPSGPRYCPHIRNAPKTRHRILDVPPGIM